MLFGRSPPCLAVLLVFAMGGAPALAHAAVAAPATSPVRSSLDDLQQRLSAAIEAGELDTAPALSA